MDHTAILRIDRGEMGANNQNSANHFNAKHQQANSMKVKQSLTSVRIICMTNSERVNLIWSFHIHIVKRELNPYTNKQLLYILQEEINKHKPS